jgi:hypothetical protein
MNILFYKMKDNQWKPISSGLVKASDRFIILYTDDFIPYGIGVY